MDSNHRPYGYEPYALANWATSPYDYIHALHEKWDLQGSNLWPSACKADALPAELNSLELSDFHISQGATPNYFRRSRA